MNTRAQSDFFISYATADRAWAEWIAYQLEEAGYRVVMPARSLSSGQDFVQEIRQAAAISKRIIAVLSPAYFASSFGEAEWRGAFAKDPSGSRGLLIPIRVQESSPPGLLASLIYLDLVGKSEQSAKQILLSAVNELDDKPSTPAVDRDVGGPALIRR
jgi:hypothetical protein